MFINNVFCPHHYFILHIKHCPVLELLRPISLYSPLWELYWCGSFLVKPSIRCRYLQMSLTRDLIQSTFNCRASAPEVDSLFCNVWNLCNANLTAAAVNTPSMHVVQRNWSYFNYSHIHPQLLAIETSTWLTRICIFIILFWQHFVLRTKSVKHFKTEALQNRRLRVLGELPQSRARLLPSYCK